MLLGQDFGGVYLYLLFAVNVSLTKYFVCPKSKNQAIKGDFFRLFSTIIRKKRNLDKKNICQLSKWAVHHGILRQEISIEIFDYELEIL